MDVTAAPATLALTSVTFPSPLDTCAHYIYISTTDGTTFLPDSDFTGTVNSDDSASDENYLVVESGRQPDSVPLYHFLFAPSAHDIDGKETYTVYTGPETTEVSETTKVYSVDIPSCGWDDIPCPTIASAFAHAVTSTSQPDTLTIAVYSGTLIAEANQTSFNQKSVTVTPSTSDTINKPLGASAQLTDSLFICDGANLAFTSFSFTIAASSISYSLFDISSGTLYLTSVSMAPSSVVTVSKPLIRFSDGGSVAIVASAFKKIKLDSGSTYKNGAVVSGTLGNEQTFTVTGTAGDGDSPSVCSEFSECTAADGKGGAIAVSCEDGSQMSFNLAKFEDCTANSEGGGLYVSMSGESTVSFVECTFDGCSVSGENGKGGGIYANLGSCGKLGFDEEYDGERTEPGNSVFRSCSASGTNGVGGGIYVESGGSESVDYEEYRIFGK